MPRIGPEEKEEAARWLAQGKSTDWVATRFGISVTTVRAWRRKDPEFRAVLERHIEGLRVRGLRAVVERGAALPASALKSKDGVVAGLRDALLEVGRKEANRGR